MFFQDTKDALIDGRIGFAEIDWIDWFTCFVEKRADETSEAAGADSHAVVVDMWPVAVWVCDDEWVFGVFEEQIEDAFPGGLPVIDAFAGEHAFALGNLVWVLGDVDASLLRVAGGAESSTLEEQFSVVVACRSPVCQDVAGGEDF